MPAWTGFLTPILQVLEEGRTYSRSEIFSLVADHTGLTADQMAERISSGGETYKNRIGWAISYLSRINALDRPTRGNYSITDGGQKLKRIIPTIHTEVEVNNLIKSGKAHGLVPYTPTVAPVEQSAEVESAADHTEVTLDPIEQIQNGVDRIHNAVAEEILQRLHQNEPAFFEQTVVDLVVAMGYAGADGAAARTQLSNDGGIDGVVDQDVLGLNRVYIQAKRNALDSTVGRPDIQAFVGALHGVQADRGVFITTAKYSPAARQYAESVNTRVILIDGTRLASLMIRYGVGVQVSRTVEIVKIDEDYFE
ncbi:restriction system protein [Brevibacterium sanguinis]|uniref:Restriction system protein n=2 Tax=Brevibacterium TaxID=1696 RepID=A0A366IDY9_9MICO|nr:MULTISPECIES: restriction endonuclease [Brevibacterium]RBP62776.1 restriction system protein [Brevibacterium sanguinis]RBP69341.1 restriction system protein [Brevibacterium celere]